MSKSIEELQKELETIQAEIEAKKKVVPLRKEETTEEAKVEAEPIPTEKKDEEEQPQGEKIVTLLQLGYTETGRPIFDVQGDANLLTLEGLLVFGRRKLDEEWTLREAMAAKAAEEARKAKESDAKNDAEKGRR